MDRGKKSITFLDTHCLIWLRAGLVKKFSSRAKDIINSNDLYFSPLVRLELQYLYDIKRIKEKPEVILISLENNLNLNQSDSPYEKVIGIAISLSWTRDVFDRLLTAEAKLHNGYLITADKTILKNYSRALI